MTFLNFVDRFANIGVKWEYKAWEADLARKLNFFSLIASINVSIFLCLSSVLGNYDFHFELLMTLLVAPFVVLLNYFKNYIWSAYMFYLIGLVLIYFLTLKMGLDSFVILFYFPIFISLIQIFGKKKILIHLVVILGLFFISTIALTIGYEHNFLKIDYSKEIMLTLRSFNIISSFSLTIILISMLSYENARQETIIKKTLDEKDILLAEVFHRVKNNMNIVTSLLNLKKHASKSEEVKVALEECRERVFSMALVHQKIYSNRSINSLNFKEYIDDLVNESVNSIGGADKVEVDFKTENIVLPLFYAIPCGLILNELITNSFKHAQIPGQKLRLEIVFKNDNDQLFFKVKDNGPGFNFDKNISNDSLGLELVKSLAEQIDGKYTISNQNGCCFEVSFQKSLS